MKKRMICFVGMVVLVLGLIFGTGIPVFADTSGVDVATLDELISAMNSDAEVINLTGQIQIDRSITLGDANNPKTITRNESGQIYVTWSDFNIIMFQSITFDGGGYESPMVKTSSETVFSDCTIKNVNGTAISMYQNNYGTFERCTFKDNQNGNRGGHLGLLGSGTYTLTDCTFTGGKANKEGYADNEGGAIYIGHNSATVTMSGCTVTGNSSLTGGGISNKGNLTVTNCLIYGNTCDNLGQDIHSEGTLTLNDSLEDINSKLDEQELTSEGWWNEDTQSLQDTSETITGTMNLTLKTAQKEQEQEQEEPTEEPTEEDSSNTGTSSSGSTGSSSSTGSTGSTSSTTNNYTTNNYTVNVPQNTGTSTTGTSTQASTGTSTQASTQTTGTGSNSVTQTSNGTGSKDSTQTVTDPTGTVTVTTEKKTNEDGQVVVNNTITVNTTEPTTAIDDVETPTSSQVLGVTRESEQKTSGIVTNVLLLGVIIYLISDKIIQKRRK